MSDAAERIRAALGQDRTSPRFTAHEALDELVAERDRLAAQNHTLGVECRDLQNRLGESDENLERLAARVEKLEAERDEAMTVSGSLHDENIGLSLDATNWEQKAREQTLRLVAAESTVTALREALDICASSLLEASEGWPEDNAYERAARQGLKVLSESDAGARPNGEDVPGAWFR